MRNVWLVVKREIITTMRRRSFWFTTFVLPLLIGGLSVLPQITAQDAFSSSGALAGVAASVPVGYVDQAGIIQRLPEDLPPDALVAYPDQEAARAALVAGEVSRFYLIPPDFIETGDVVVVDRQFSPVAGFEGSERFEYVLDANLVGDDRVARLVMNPVARTEARSLAPQSATANTPPRRDETNPLTFVVPLGVMFILFFTITMSGGFMLQSVVREKENRTAEILLVSLRPVELMLGKVIGLGVVALFQMAVWMGGGLLLLGGGFVVASAALGYSLPAGFLLWALIYFLLGYLLYSSMLGALGALAPGMREGSQFTFVLLMPLMIPLWLNSAFLNAPDGALVTILSLFPLTAPTSMMTRMAAVSVPFWQPLVGSLGLALTTCLFVMLSARFFRADTLLSSASLNWGRLWRELRGGA